MFINRVILTILLLSGLLLADTYIVSQSGGDFSTIQSALNAASAGDSILVKQESDPYYEKINIPHGGTASDGYLTLMAYPGHHPVIDGTGVPNNPASYTDDLIYMENISYVRVIGFELRNVNTPEGSGIRVYGYGAYIEIRDNEIHDIRGGGESGGAMGITIYGASDDQSLNHIIIDNNHIHDCDPAWSEALTLNGNVEQFEVTNNLVEDVNNIGIDFIGGEDWLSSKYARNGRCAWNQVYRARSSYEDGYAAGIYVDGGADIVIENNIISQCDLGIEVGAENAGVVTTGIKVRNNIVYANDKTGIVFGGYDVTTGRVKNCEISGNACYKNDTLKTGHGELWIQYAEDNTVRNNIFYANQQDILLYSETGNINNTLNFNLWYTESGPDNGRFIWNSMQYVGFSDYQTGTGQDGASAFSDPLFLDASGGDFHIATNSPAVNLGDPSYTPESGESDMDGESRVSGSQTDAGADEVQITSATGVKPHLPGQFGLIGAYPNPFGQSAAFGSGTQTTIRAMLEKSGPVNMAVFDIRGRKVKNLLFGYASAGEMRIVWNGTDQYGNRSPAGVYFIRLSAHGKSASLKTVLIR